MLRIDDLTVTYRGVVGVQNISLEVAAGEALALLGPNGAGKSSVLRGVVGSASTTGVVTFDGHVVSRMPTHRRARRGIVQVPQGGRLFRDLSVEENLQLGGYGLRKRERDERMAEVLEFFPRVKERRRVKAGSLSGGEQQMLAIGRALMAHPKLILLDEPSLGLSPLMVTEVFEHIGRLHAFGVAMVLVDQNAVKAISVADRVCVLDRGRCVYQGSAEEARADIEMVSAHLGLIPDATPY